MNTLDIDDTDLEPRSVVDEVVEQMRMLISERGLTIGDQLPTEKELCETFGASRNTVREAMRILKAYGIVKVRQKVGATIVDNRMSSALGMFSFNVMEISRETFSDIQGFRCLLEVSSVEEIFDRITDEDLADLRLINATMLETEGVEAAAEQDFLFHTRLVRILRNKAILDVYGLMKPVILRIIQNGKTRHTFENETYYEHEAVIDAIVARDRIAYQYRMKTHLETGYAHFRETGPFADDPT
ncbi:DNA-binding FadR family transcriptional regulator [Yoonia maritima]|uniref:DNA-binding FadR family transcriptional regulator n=1 Tax=Yoonia maritima TaxID=1435347 RepID=A0A2T0VZX6_9RHOB|nr:FadR/GntR family transcriptional regulator [Yoonia maritima]PRY78093.1 DNA-binding FadR family transcriptional regulator [Yoonia maritima]